jgi:hypothetical protein
MRDGLSVSSSPTRHTYNKQTAQKVAAAVPDFASACERLITVLAKRLDDAAPDTE